MPPRPRPYLAGLVRAAHGGVTAAELAALGLDSRQVLDFSVNTNPFGPPPGVGEAVASADVTRYPDPESRELRAALARRLDVPPECILVGNGSVELVWLAALSYLDHGDQALVLGPTFDEYAAAARIAGAEVRRVMSCAEQDFAPDLAFLERELSRLSPKVAFCCNPNNPTGVHVPAEQWRRLAQAHPDTLLVVDEAYLPFLARPESCLESGLIENLLMLRSMTKDCGIPGLRLGYAIAPEPLLAPLRVAQPPWSVSAPAQAAGLAALRTYEQVGQSLAALREVKDYLIEALSSQGLEILPSATNFFLARVGDGASFRRALLQEGCCVRDCASFGLPEYVRIAVRTLPECRTLVAAVARVLTSEPLLPPRNVG
ncbi:MAG: histidinol-phosphate aminotransferase family protein [Chloroflexi bacterium]|nr:histidinol-phosphate aminotransferase family protein [Chloroflexota bacterium]